jgi:hypothetical protein
VQEGGRGGRRRRGRPGEGRASQRVEPTRVTLTEDAAKPARSQTAATRDVEIRGAMRHVIPYSAILYDTEGTPGRTPARAAGVRAPQHQGRLHRRRDGGAVRRAAGRAPTS